MRILTLGARTTRTTGTARTTRATRTTISARTAGTTAATGTTTTGAAVASTGTAATRTTRVGAHPLGTIAAEAATRTATTGATGTTSAARTTRTTGATRTTRATASTAIAEVTRCSRQLPADSRTRHLATTGTVIFLLVFFRSAELEAAEALGLVAIAATTKAAGAATAATTTGTATTATLAAATTTTLAAATRTAVIATRALRTGDAIDHVVELAARNGAVRTLLTLEHANEANLVDATADDVECLEQARGAIGLHAERGRDRTDRRIFLLGRFGLRLATFSAALGRCLCRLAALGGCLSRWLGRCVSRYLGRLATVGRNARVGGFAARCVGHFDVRRARCLGCRRRRSTGCCTGCGCVSQQERRELGERLHRPTVATPKMADSLGLTRLRKRQRRRGNIPDGVATRER